MKIIINLLWSFMKIGKKRLCRILFVVYWGLGYTILIVAQRTRIKSRSYLERVQYLNSRLELLNKEQFYFDLYCILCTVYAPHYNPWFVYFLPNFWSSFIYCDPYVWLVSKSSFYSRAGYSGSAYSNPFLHISLPNPRSPLIEFSSMSSF